MLSVTEQKPFEEIKESLSKCKSVYVIGCGTCATELHTGGKAEVLEMKEKLEAEGKTVPGWMVIPTACDELTKYALESSEEEINKADCLLVMSCSYGVHQVGQFNPKPSLPALNTLFIGKENLEGVLDEVCSQCGDCVLAWTGGICPVTSCPKGLLNGPCGGTNNGKCEVDSEKDCAWTLIYNRLKDQDRLDLLEKDQPPKNYQAVVKPGRLAIN